MARNSKNEYVTLRVDVELIKSLDRWRRQTGGISRSEAMRITTRLGLGAACAPVPTATYKAKAANDAIHTTQLDFDF